MNRNFSKIIPIGFWIFIHALLFLSFLFQISNAQTLPDTPANRARGVAGCTQTSTGIVCPGAGGFGGGSSGEQLQMNMMNSLMNGFMQGLQSGLEAQGQRQQGIERRQEADIQGYWDMKLRKQEERFDDQWRKSQSVQEKFQRSRNNMLGLMEDSGGALISRDPALGDGLEVVPEKGVFGIPVLKPASPPEKSRSVSLAPREIKIPAEPSPQLPVVDPKIVSGDFQRTALSFKATEPPSPKGFRSEDERRERLARLTDRHIDLEIKRSMQILKKMQKDFAQDPKALEHWLEKSQQAEEEALMASFSLMSGGALEKWEKVWKNYPRLKALAEGGLKILNYEGPVRKLAEDFSDKEANREMSRKTMIDLYSELQNFDEELVSGAAGGPIALADFLVDYVYSTTRWGLARSQVLLINENLDKPNGKLEAQLSIKRVLEDLISERDRRKRGSKNPVNEAGAKN